MNAYVAAIVFLAGTSVVLAQSGGRRAPRATASSRPGAFVRESARRLPVAEEVDVVVAGGSSGAVAAAVAAAEAGASVFLAAPRPHLGDDMCETLRLWLEPDERPTTPLAKKLFGPGGRAKTPHPNALPFTYEADLPSVAPHRDTRPPSRLRDGRWSNPQGESVQYDGDVTITADLGRAEHVEKAHVLVYHRSDFQVARVEVSVSEDKKTWQKAATAANEHPPQADRKAPALTLSAEIARPARYVRFCVRRAAGSKRILLGEIVLTGRAGKRREGAPRPHSLVTPLHVKKTLDAALLEAKVRFLFGCYPTDVLRDAEGKPCGIVMANRAGRQAVVAKVVIDATDRAWLARLAGARTRAAPPGEHTFRRVVIGGEVRRAKGLAGRKIGLSYPGAAVGRGKRAAPAGRYDVIEYTLTLPLGDGGFAAVAEAENKARDLTHHPQQVAASGRLFSVPPDSIAGVSSDPASLGAFRPKGVERLFVLGGCADLPRDQAERLLRPPAFMAAGRRIGAAAAAAAKKLAAPKDPHVGGRRVTGAGEGEVREALSGSRPVGRPKTLAQGARPLGVLGTYDVVVIGGGTSGAPAGIAAARQGRRVLVVEYQDGLGGVGTLGLIGRYHRGYRGGFTAEVDKATGAKGGGWSVVRKMEWWRRALRDAGADVWFGCLGCGALVRDGRVTGVVVATPHGRGVVRAKVVIDATGNADVAASAGAACMYTDGTCVAVQGTGLPARRLGANYTNTDFTITDETDMADVWQLLVYARRRYGGAFDVGGLIDTRERRRVVGDFTLTLLDQVNSRTYPDSIAQAVSNLDTHGYTVALYPYLRHPGTLKCFVPYRCLLPKGLEGLLVIGLGLSAHRDAVPYVRMQSDLQNLGYAAGVAAAMAAKAGAPVRGIDVRKLQRHLVKLGNLPAAVLTHQDSYPLSTRRIAAAVRSMPDGYKGAAVVLAHPKESLPMLRRAWAQAAQGADRLAYAHVLGLMGDATGVETLIAAVEAADGLGDGYEYRGMGHDHSRRRMSQVDSLLHALGRTRDRRATPAVLAKLKLLGPKRAFSHHYAVAVALEHLRDPAAAPHLAALLGKAGMSGHAIETVGEAMEKEKPPLGNATRRNSFREIVLARALLRCGDHDGLARRLLEAYTKDLRGHFARHAAAVLAGE